MKAVSIPIFVAVLAFGAGGGWLHGQNLESVAAEREKRLEETMEELRELRASIREERQPLVRKLNKLEAKAGELEEKVNRARRLRDNKSVELETLRERVEAKEEEIGYVTRTLLPSFVSDYDTALPPAERQSTGEVIREYNLFLEDGDASEGEKLQRGLDLMRDALSESERLLGGRRFEGEALGPEGRIREGRFLQVGPLGYFLAEDGETAGWVTEARKMIPDFQPLAGDKGARIAETLRGGGDGPLPVDPTLGDALAVSRTKEGIAGHLAKGGVWVYPILLFAVVATIVAVAKGLQVFGIRHPKPMVIHEIVKALRSGDEKRARQLAEAQPKPAREMLLSAVEHSGESVELVEEIMYESLLTTQPRLERFLNVIAVTAAAAPLLGLLGTVTGIIKTFRLMTVFGAGDPKPLISGISEALITTELGLILAIPSLILHALLSRKVAGTMARLEKTAVTFINGLSRTRTEKETQA